MRIVSARPGSAISVSLFRFRVRYDSRTLPRYLYMGTESTRFFEARWAIACAGPQGEKWADVGKMVTLESCPQPSGRGLHGVCIPAEVRVLSAFAARSANRPCARQAGKVNFCFIIEDEFPYHVSLFLIGKSVNGRRCAPVVAGRGHAGRADASKPTTRLTHRGRPSKIA